MSLLCRNLQTYPNYLQDISQHLSIASMYIVYRWVCTHSQTHRVEEDISINYPLKKSGEEILIVSELLIEFRWQTCADMLLVKLSANRHKHCTLHDEDLGNRRKVLSRMCLFRRSSKRTFDYSQHIRKSKFCDCHDSLE